MEESYPMTGGDGQFSYAKNSNPQAPAELGDQLNSTSCNKGRIYYSNAPNEVGQAYSAQYAKDIGSFLCARAEELAPGGLMNNSNSLGVTMGQFLAQSSMGPHFEDLESSLLDMAKEGIISKDRIDSFNLPIYSPSMEELRTLIQENGCFEIVRLDGQPQKYPTITAMECRAGLEGIFSKHFGSENMDPLFNRCAKIIDGRPLKRNGHTYSIGLFVLLKRKKLEE
uniref:Uncharacterized protein n=1 Tax=Fagus sylvatica TaxID=28930 RepID=A0A2N9GQD6_FAGSY